MVATVEKAEWQVNLDKRIEVGNELFLIDEALIDLQLIYPHLTRFEQPKLDKAIKYLDGKRDRLRSILKRLEA